MKKGVKATTNPEINIDRPSHLAPPPKRIELFRRDYIPQHVDMSDNWLSATYSPVRGTIKFMTVPGGFGRFLV